MGIDSVLAFAGSISTLDMGTVTVGANAALTVGSGVGSISAGALFSLLAKTGEGSVAIEGGGATVLSVADHTPCGTASGGLPGAVTLELTAPVCQGGATGTQTFAGGDSGAFLATVFGMQVWDSGSETSADGRGFTLFKLPAHSPAFPDNHQGGLAYSAVCAGYGLQPIGCNGGGGWDATMLGMPGSWSCNIDGALHSHTGWTGLAFYESNGNMYGVNSGGGSDSSPDAGTSPVCALAH